MRDDIWFQSEGNRWFARNEQVLGSPAMLQYDWPLRLIRLYGLDPRTVVEIGASTGWRLNALSESGRRVCIGVDASAEAIADGRARYPDLELHHALATALPLRDGLADLVILSFVLHWVSRESLLLVAAEADRILKVSGHLILADFAPDHPTRVPYKHRTGLWTWKLPDAHSGIFLATGLYRQVATVSFDHDNHDNRADTPSERRGACALLRKESTYQI